MIHDLFINLMICLTSLYISHQWITPAIHRLKSSLTKNILLGLLYGGIGILLMNFHIRLTSIFWIDLRHIPVLIAALYGGSIPAVISAALIGMTRILWFHASISAWLALLNLLLSAGLCRWVCRKAWDRRVKGIVMIGGIYLLLVLGSIILYPNPFYYRKAMLLYGIFLTIGGLSSFSLLEFLKASKESMEKLQTSDQALKEMVMELQSTKDQLESFMTHSGDAIAIMDTHSRVIKANLAFEKMYGWSEEEIVGQFNPCVPAEDRHRLTDIIKQVIVHGQEVIDLEVNARTKSGNRIEVAVTISAIKDQAGKMIGISGVSRDITERKEMERELVNNEAKYRAIVENTSDLIAVYGSDQILHYVSPSHQKVLGYTPQFLSELPGLIHPEDLAKVVGIFHGLFEHPKQTELFFRLRHLNGSWVYLHSFFMPVLSEHEKLENVITISRDITKLKQEEELVIRSEKLSVVGQLASGVAHEIRNPLTTLKGFVQIMKQQDLGNRTHLELMHSELDRIEQITNEFLVLAKPQAVEFKEVDFHALINQLVLLMEIQGILNNVQIQTDLNSTLPFIHCDINQIKQVLINLLKNSIEAMPKGGTIFLRVQQVDDTYIQITIEDQGEGIPPDRLTRLGEPFYSLKEKGTGLGIMICHRIINDHRGKLRFQSTVNTGTTVEILLPILPDKLAINKSIR